MTVLDRQQNDSDEYRKHLSSASAHLCQKQGSEGRRRRTGSSIHSLRAAILTTGLLSLAPTVSSWSTAARTAMRIPPNRQDHHHQAATAIAGSVYGGDEDDITRLQQKAQAELEKAKAKLGAVVSSAAPKTTQQHQADAENEMNASPTFFFAQIDTSSRKRQAVTKTVNEATGLITTDGEKMAQLSETEEWESRPLNEVFDNELSEQDDVYSMAAKQLAERDVAASIWNLRKELQNEDYQRIFDRKNRFIGETE